MGRRDEVLKTFDEKWPAVKVKAEQNIEQYRKGDVSIILKDEQGNPVSGAKIRAVQKKHEFKHGANIFMLGQLETEEKNCLYEQYFKDAFNMATLPFYWDATEPEKGKQRYDKDSVPMYRRPPIDTCMEFCEKNGIEPREHALAYERFFPQWLEGMSNDEVKAELERRYQEVSERYADRIPTIEVTNEMFWKDHKVTPFYEDPEYVEWCFKLAEKYFPNNQLVINEVTRMWDTPIKCWDKYYQIIENTLMKGARIDAVGLQYHMFYRREAEAESTVRHYDPDNLYRTLDEYSRFGKPIQVTEVTIPAYSWETEDEQIQAEIIEKLYYIWFSHPAVQQIVYWNLVDGYAHLWTQDLEAIRASQGNMSLGENYYYGGLLRFDLSPKPAYEVIKNLFGKVWHTETEMVTVDGKADFRGFYGTYDLEIEAEGKTVVREVKLQKNGPTEIAVTI